MDEVKTPMLFPYEPEQFWKQMQVLIRDELKKSQASQPIEVKGTPGLTYKPLYKINEVCAIFKVTKPTIYDWIKHGKLKPFKVRSRLYFLSNDIQALLNA
ncbi:MAG TPA: helix-turn-helix domain-containing protein [Puia sp.]